MVPQLFKEQQLLKNIFFVGIIFLYGNNYLNKFYIEKEKTIISI